jgi:hypothetical protein
MATWSEEASQDMKIISRTGGVNQADVTALNLAITQWADNNPGGITHVLNVGNRQVQATKQGNVIQRVVFWP